MILRVKQLRIDFRLGAVAVFLLALASMTGDSECDRALDGGDVSARRGAFVAVLVCRIGVYSGDAVRHGVECGVWDGGAVAAL